MQQELELPDMKVVGGRLPLTTFLAHQKRVLHVGCVDEGLFEEKREGGVLLHDLLRRACRSVVGIDISAAGIERMRALGYEDVHRIDITAWSSAEQSRFGPFDLILVPEVIEHVSDLGAFLAGVRDVAKLNGAGIVLSTPNALGQFKQQFLHRTGLESNHPDHLYYYSANSLSVALRRSGLKAVRWYGYDGAVPPRKHRLVDDEFSKFCRAMGFLNEQTLRFPALQRARAMLRGETRPWRSPHECSGLIVVCVPMP